MTTGDIRKGSTGRENRAGLGSIMKYQEKDISG